MISEYRLSINVDDIFLSRSRSDDFARLNQMFNLIKWYYVVLFLVVFHDFHDPYNSKYSSVYNENMKMKMISIRESKIAQLTWREIFSA